MSVQKQRVDGFVRGWEGVWKSRHLLAVGLEGVRMRKRLANRLIFPVYGRLLYIWL